MQVCTIVSGQTAVTASGSPVSPSQTTIRTSSTPRALSSFITRSQKFAPSVASTQMPRTSFLPSVSTPTARCAALLRTVPLSRTLQTTASRKITGQTRSSGRDCHSATSSSTESVIFSDQVRADGDVVDLGQVGLDVAHRHAARVEADHQRVDAVPPPGTFGHDLRSEGAGPVPRHLQVHVAGLGQQPLRADPV